MKYTEPEIVYSDSRSYVTFYLEGKRKRVYSGKDLGVPIFPNRARNLVDRNRRLEDLRKEILRQLVAGTFGVPVVPEQFVQDMTIGGLLRSAFQVKMNGPYSTKYKRDIKLMYEDFYQSFSRQELDQPLSYLTVGRLNTFLQKYNSSGTYYMRKRSDLRILLNYMYRQVSLPSIMKDTMTTRTTERAHEVYTPQELSNVLTYIKGRHKKLFLGCMLTYGCWLRPHIEVRNLKLSSFVDDFHYIQLSGSEVKSKKIRKVYVPSYVRREIEIFEFPKYDVNIFTRTTQPPNEWYFSTQFTRLKKEMLALGIIKKNHTIYSFRHTAALDLYNKTKDIAVVMRAMGHSSIRVTERYLKSIGNISPEQLAQSTPSEPALGY